MKTEIKVYAALITTMFGWGLSYIATKTALTDISVHSLVLSRFTAAALVFIILLIVKGIPSFTLRDHIKIIITSAIFPFLYFLLETTALKYTSVSEASLIAAIIPVIVMIFSSLFLKEGISRTGAVSIFCSFIGITLLVMGNPSVSFSFEGGFFGNLLMFGAVLSASVYMILTRDLGKKYTSFEITSVQIVYGAICFVVLASLNYDKIDFTGLTVKTILALMFLVIISTIISFFSYNYALTKIEAAKASVFINGVPVVTAASAMIFFNERLYSVQWAGGVIVIIAVAITNIYGGQIESGSDNNISYPHDAVSERE